ncbi:MAG: AAA family ATPase [Candidatus Electrothrix aestuarii]|uniref:AAA family ATPase n=1 Tax=Candidatus Electrothrix aestuarii TaxID=3062594 RepID=A0AAU8LXQ8_9BACT|nr:AAA family ATPase [Candidatus Electrothrix aestuarii]
MQNGNFIATLGSSTNPGLLPLEERLSWISKGENPFHADSALPGNSPVFFGRESLLYRFRLKLCTDNPGHISLVGDPRIGKSSLMNQLKAILEAEEGLVSICCNAQGLNEASQKRFFTDLGESIAGALGEKLEKRLEDFDQFQRFIRRWAKEYRFVLLLDEFEIMADNPVFDVTFFNNLRSLGDNPENCFGFFIISHEHIRALCHTEAIHGSRFWNIFDAWVLGLLEEDAARQLVKRPLQQAEISLDTTPEQFLKRYGRHPFLLQRALQEYTFSAQHGLTPDLRHLERNLYNVMQDLWMRCKEQEVARLFEVIAEKTVPHDKISQDLEERGLLNRDKLFCPDFAKALPENLIPSKTGIEEYLQEIKTNPLKALGRADRWLRYLEKIEKAATHIGKIKKAYDQVFPDEKGPTP